MSFHCFIRAAEHGVAHLFLQAHLRALSDVGRFRVNDRKLVLLPCGMRANDPKRGLSLIISNCSVDSIAEAVAFERANKTDLTLPDFLGWFLCEFTEATVISAPRWRSESFRRSCRRETLLRAVHAKATL